MYQTQVKTTEKTVENRLFYLNGCEYTILEAIGFHFASSQAHICYQIARIYLVAC